MVGKTAPQVYSLVRFQSPKHNRYILKQKSMDKKQQIQHLAFDSSIIIVKFICDKCFKEESRDGCMGDEIDAANDIFKSGWRVRNNTTYCPKCVKKYIKKSK